jgi:multidrug efflux pump subunit AcrA (membrane-fusion protein)
MRARVHRLLRNGLSQIPTLLILAVLVTLLCWGHFRHWEVPRFAELWGRLASASHSTSASPPPPPTAVRRLEPASSGAGAAYEIRLGSPEAIRKVGMRFARAEERPLTWYVTGTGRLDFDQTRYAELTSRLPGTVWRVLKREGDHVRAGDVLALVAAAEVGQAKAKLLEALVQVDLRNRTLKRYQAAASAIPAVAIFNASASLREARLQLHNSHQALLNLGLALRLEDVARLSEEQASRRLRLLGLPPEVLEQVDPETLTMNLLPLCAPFDGEVVKRDTVVGEVIRATTPQFVVADLRTLWVLLDVPTEDAADLAAGQPVTFQGGRGAAAARGSVAWISRGVDKKTRTVRVRAEVPNPDRRLRPDVFGTGRIQVRTVPRAVAVPAEAVQRDEGADLVFVRRPGDPAAPAFEARRVLLGMSAERLVEVRDGVRPGEEVVTAGSYILASELVKARLQGSVERGGHAQRDH